jgi:hypothetical protein
VSEREEDREKIPKEIVSTYKKRKEEDNKET